MGVGIKAGSEQSKKAPCSPPGTGHIEAKMTQSAGPVCVPPTLFDNKLLASIVGEVVRPAKPPKLLLHILHFLQVFFPIDSWRLIVHRLVHTIDKLAITLDVDQTLTFFRTDSWWFLSQSAAEIFEVDSCRKGVI